MPSRPGTRVILQVAGTVVVAVMVVGVFANLRTEPASGPAGEQTQVRGIAAADLRGDVVTPTPVEKPVTDAKRETRKPAAPRRAQEAAKETAKPQEPVRVQTVAVVPVDPGPPLPLTPAQNLEDPSFVTAAGKTSLSVLRTSTTFVTTTVPNAVVSTTREAVDKAKSFGTAVLDKVIP
jgi:hypothetical protein